MLDRTNMDATERVTLLVRQILAKRAIERPVGADEDLATG
jgi:hypothetical protein